MPSLDWTVFNSLPGSKDKNFENLCRGLMHLHFGQYGYFRARANQPGVEFHIRLTESCSLGAPPKWFGWQCKFFTRTQNGDLTAASKKDIEHSLQMTEKVLSEVSDWILWTPYTLSKTDQEWFDALQTKMKLHLWDEAALDTYLNGPGSLLKSTHFGGLVITPNDLAEQHKIAIQPIKSRWIEPVHQSVDAERNIRKMLGEPSSWDDLIATGESLSKAAKILAENVGDDSELKQITDPFILACSTFGDTLLRFHEILAEGNLDTVLQKLKDREILLSEDVKSVPRRLRLRNLAIAVDATNALNDMRVTQKLLSEVEEYLEVGLVALLADAGAGKTQMSAQLTASQQYGRPAGILLCGRSLHKGHTLDELAARHFSINGNPINSIEKLLAALDAAGKRHSCRLPILIDGLNEAEDPREWKDHLAKLSEMVKKYPNILVVCTLRTGERRREDRNWQRKQVNARESFAVMALPEHVRKIESEGFGNDVASAVQKYFAHFKINPGDAEIPLELFQHPLNLRIFCQATNPTREREVKVDYFPASLSMLLEKFIATACERISEMTNLSYRYTVEDINAAIYTLGIQMWEAQEREISEKGFREAVSDSSRSWDSSIVNLLAQEGIIFRNPGDGIDYMITPAYDTLGGYIIANALLKKYSSDASFDWFNKQEAMNSFSGDDNHPLAVDIFKSLVSLTPRRMNGNQLWKKTSEFRDSALGFSLEIEPTYIDTETVNAFLSLLKDNPVEKSYLFSKLRGARSSENHPFNAKFLDSVLRAMAMAERDLSWTEWIRKERQQRFNDLLAIEQRWKMNFAIRTPADRLRVKWVMWLLTSTDHQLRDIATRTLYWFGRGDAGTLFDESIRALEVNDPYVPERMLAACYGVTMAKYADLAEPIFKTSTLPTYAKHLYANIFTENAPHSTTHCLMREYAFRIIEIARMHDSELFSDKEKQRSQPPFADGGVREWGEIDTKKEQSRAESPFRMDFENYTIGRLVRDRSNYDYDHAGYKKIRANILWRIEQLGWTSELFGKIDESIGKDHWARTGDDKKKTDRYGKKYSWIAFFEMHGFLQDQVKSEDSRERTSDVDIDPSFPDPITKDELIKDDFLGDPQMSIKGWVESGPSPNMEPYLHLKKIKNIDGPWIALDGFVVEQDESRGRRLFCFVRSFLIANKDLNPFMEHLSKQDLSGRWLPEKPDVIYTFAGEIPWCKTFPPNEVSEFSFVTKEEVVKVQKTDQEFYLDGKKLDWSEADLMLRNLLGHNFDKANPDEISDEDLKRIEIREISIEVEQIKRQSIEFKGKVPVCDFGWEGYQSAANDSGHATTLAKEIAIDLDLIGQPQTFDLYTKEGLKATFNIGDLKEDFNNHQRMFFIKEDLLRKYLKKHDVALIWAIWGERGYSTNQAEKLFHSPNRPEKTHVVFGTIKNFD